MSFRDRRYQLLIFCGLRVPTQLVVGIDNHLQGFHREHALFAANSEDLLPQKRTTFGHLFELARVVELDELVKLREVFGLHLRDIAGSFVRLRASDVMQSEQLR